MKKNIKIALAIVLTLIGISACTSKDSIIEESQEVIIQPVMKYEGIWLPSEASISKVTGEALFAIENQGMISAKVKDKIVNDSVLLIGKGAYVLIECKNQKCVEFNPAPKARWIKFIVE